MGEVMIMAEGIDKSKKKNEEILAAITLANQDEEKTLAQIADEQSFSKRKKILLHLQEN